MNRPTTLALLLAFATWLVPNVAVAGLQDIVTLHGIDREADIPLPRWGSDFARIAMSPAS